MTAVAAARGPRSPFVLVPTQKAVKTVGAATTQAVQALNQAYVTALQAVGLTPILVPTGRPLPEDLSWVSGLLLPGGPDVDPRRYGQDRDPTTESEQESDQLEFALLDWALEAGIPVLAICRGLQVLNVALGGTLFQDLPRHSPHPDQAQPVARDEPVHTLTVEASSRLGRMVNARTIAVNSLHHQGIDELARGLVATGWAHDGLIEAVEARGETFLVGVQYHPEELVAHDPAARAVFQGFARACRQAQGESPVSSAPAELASSVARPDSAG